MSEAHAPESFVERQLAAYNARDLERFVAEYTDDVEVYRLPGTQPVLAGKAAFADYYRTQRFDRPRLHAEVLQRMVVGRTVIDRERITGVQDSPLELAIVYETTPAGIRRVWLVSA